MRVLFVLATLLVCGFANAQVMALKDKPAIDEKAIKLHFSMLGIQASDIQATPIAGLAQVMTDKGIFYMSTDGNYLMQGKLYDFKAGMVNETERALANVRKQGLAKFESDVITYKAKNEKHVVTVFTDITCGYCRKLHREIEQYNDLGITVRYLAFPRAGIGAQAFADMESVWCAADKQAAMTAAKVDDKVTAKKCETSVTEQYLFGQQVGITGTPAIILADGSLQPGYVPASRLITVLEQR